MNINLVRDYKAYGAMHSIDTGRNTVEIISTIGGFSMNLPNGDYGVQTTVVYRPFHPIPYKVIVKTGIWRIAKYQREYKSLDSAIRYAFHFVASYDHQKQV